MSRHSSLDEVTEAVSDADLIARVRAGDADAYGELYERHSAAAVGLARRYARNASDAEDLAAEAFANMLTVLRSGSGPDEFFRAYLFTTLARLAARRNDKEGRQRPVEDVADYEKPTPYEDPVLRSFESRTVVLAYRSLPERWQAVLWYTEVDRMQPAAVAPLLGLTANGVAALALRAREGLRQAYLQQHLARTAGEDCAAYADKLGAYVRNGLTARNEAKVREHLDQCSKCTALLLQLEDVGAGMRGIIYPLIAGVSLSGAAAVAGAGATGGALAAAKTAASSAWKWAAANPVAAGGVAAASVAVAVAGAVAVGAATAPATPVADPNGTRNLRTFPDALATGSAGATVSPGTGSSPRRGAGPASSSASAATGAPTDKPLASAAGSNGAGPTPSALPSLLVPALPAPALPVPAVTLPSAVPTPGLPAVPVLPGPVAPPPAPSVPVPSVPAPPVSVPQPPAPQPTTPAPAPGPGAGAVPTVAISAPAGPSRLVVTVTMPPGYDGAASLYLRARVDWSKIPPGTPGIPPDSTVVVADPPAGWWCDDTWAGSSCSTRHSHAGSVTFTVRVSPLPHVPQLLTAVLRSGGFDPVSASASY